MCFYNAAPLVSFASVVLHLGGDTIHTFPLRRRLGNRRALLCRNRFFRHICNYGRQAGPATTSTRLLGAFRVVSLLVSYEVPLVFALLVPVLLAGSMSLLDIVNAQTGMWFVVLSPLAFVIFYMSSQAETGRAPFDLIEAESELVAGFNIEYSGMKFGMFFAAEFLHVFTNGIIDGAAVSSVVGWVRCTTSHR